MLFSSNEKVAWASGTGQRLRRSTTCRMEVPAAKWPKLKNYHAHELDLHHRLGPSTASQFDDSQSA